MWERLNTKQRRIVMGAIVVLALMIVFPPIYTEAVFSFRSTQGVLGIEKREFAGWGFIGQKDLTIFADKKKLKDPDKMGAIERFEFMAGTSLEELRAMPSPKVAYGVLGLQFFLLFLGAGTAVYFAKGAVR